MCVWHMPPLDMCQIASARLDRPENMERAVASSQGEPVLRTLRGSRRHQSGAQVHNSSLPNQQQSQSHLSAAAGPHLACRSPVNFLHVVPAQLGTSSTFANLRASDTLKVTYLMVRAPSPSFPAEDQFSAA